MNYVDLFIIGVIIFYSFSGYRFGFLRVLFDITALVSSFFIALLTYAPVSLYIQRSGVREGFSLMIGFFIAWTIAEVFFYILVQLIYPKIPDKIKSSKANRIAGILPSALKGLFIVAILGATIGSSPFPNIFKDELNDSRIGKVLSQKVTFLDSSLNKIFGGAIKEATEFITVKPESDERIDLDFKATNLTIDEEAEEQMLDLINQERKKAGLKELKLEKTAREVARKHSRDMFERSYFAHENPDGLSPFDRMEAGGVKFLTAGENLALAPDLAMAHKGLMDSPGHRANILSPDFGKVGIGVIDGGVYGKMFTQNFTD